MPKAKQKQLSILKQVEKRDGEVVAFDQTKIEEAIHKAITATDQGDGPQAKALTNKVVKFILRRFKKEEKGADSYDRNEVLRKSFSLLRERKITPVQATKIEGRLNKGLVLPAELAHFFDEEGK